MDRFIEPCRRSLLLPQKHLKSNMDRFIEFRDMYIRAFDENLKSNMDRFIVNVCSSEFKHILI